MHRSPTPLRRVRARARSEEDGFTLLELVIAMVLLGVALAVVASIVMQAFGGSNGARAGSVSDAAIQRASALLADDVALANTADRRDNKLRDPADLEAALKRNDPALSSDPSEGGRTLDIDDVISASTTQLRLRSDVDLRAGVECVTWTASPTNGYELRRTVDPAGSCGRGTLFDQVLLRASNPTAAGIDTSPFTYRLLCDRATCPGSRATPSSPCRPWTVDRAVPSDQRRWIIGVDANLGVVTEQQSASGGRGSVRIAIRSRDTETYRGGLGC